MSWWYQVMRILAIDPGMSGAACIYGSQFSVKSGLRWNLIDLPTVGTGAQHRLNAVVLRDFLVQFTPDHAFIESVSAMPKQGVASMFRFGRAAGAIDATVACCGIPLTYVTPQAWKKHHGLHGPDKELSRARALQLAPELSESLARKKDHGRAESVLIALYGFTLLQ